MKSKKVPKLVEWFFVPGALICAILASHSIKAGFVACLVLGLVMVILDTIFDVVVFSGIPKGESTPMSESPGAFGFVTFGCFILVGLICAVIALGASSSAWGGVSRAIAGALFFLSVGGFSEMLIDAVKHLRAKAKQ